ncbi:AMP-binding protein [Ferrimicrobium sp.]|uniref:class I adenylate-forming enzyme family protein n=1 Tax=Ferrimicrobium sp. TaxID=2926050 RepID=UPI00260A6BB4|nr:AMP-binding protein [Ferrimicrobium sp.]
MDIGWLAGQSGALLRSVDPGWPALSLEDGVTWTYEELHTRANACTNGLIKHGVSPGDRVAILMYNSLDYWALYLGATQLGAIAVRLNFRLTREELRYALMDSQPSVVCADSELLIRIEGVRQDLIVAHYFCHGERTPELSTWCRSWDELWGHTGVWTPQRQVSLDVAAMLMYTSGTTGRPKGAVWTHGNTLWFAAMQAIRWQLTSDRVVLTTGPMYHVGAMEDLAIAVLAVGGHVVVTRSQGFDIDHTLRLIQERKVTDAVLFPFMIYQMIDARTVHDYDLSSLSRILSGGDPLLPYAVEWIQEQLPGVELVQVYGLTEGTPIASASSTRQGSPIASVGRPLPFTEISIRNDAGAPVDVDVEGEIWIRSPVVCHDYWGKPVESAETFVDGWCKTGDLGYYDADGVLFVSGRKKDMVRSGGENIYPAELESVLLSHPQVRDVAIVGVPDQRYLEAVCAVVVPDPGSRPTVTGIVDYARERLAPYKVPKYVIFVEELPRTPSGKVMKYELRDRYRDIERS